MRSDIGFGVAMLLALATGAAAAPEFSGTWVNGEGYSASSLRGKIALLVFYEEG